MLDIAVRSAVERRGVAVLVVPGDVLLKTVEDARPAAVIRNSSPVLRPCDAELDAAAKALNRASRVTILAGAGCAGAHDEVVAIAAALQAPRCSFRGVYFSIAAAVAVAGCGARFAAITEA